MPARPPARAPGCYLDERAGPRLRQVSANLRVVVNGGVWAIGVNPLTRVHQVSFVVLNVSTVNAAADFFVMAHRVTVTVESQVPAVELREERGRPVVAFGKSAPARAVVVHDSEGLYCAPLAVDPVIQGSAVSAALSSEVVSDLGCNVDAVKLEGGILVVPAEEKARVSGQGVQSAR